MDLPGPWQAATAVRLLSRTDSPISFCTDHRWTPRRSHAHKAGSLRHRILLDCVWRFLRTDPKASATGLGPSDTDISPLRPLNERTLLCAPVELEPDLCSTPSTLPRLNHKPTRLRVLSNGPDAELVALVRDQSPGKPNNRTAGHPIRLVQVPQEHATLIAHFVTAPSVPNLCIPRSEEHTSEL